MQSTQQRLLNGPLYAQLCRVFGRNNCRVHKAGQAGEFGAKPLNLFGSYSKMRMGRTGASGEEYSVRCPICHDHKPRLYFNYRWGTVDPYSGSRVLWLCHCYNEECQRELDNRIRLADMVFGGAEIAFTVEDSNATVASPAKVRWPGIMQTLTRVYEADPRHPAITWILSRPNITVELLAKHYDVRLCLIGEGRYANVTGRLVVPSYLLRNGEPFLAMWTARKILPQDEGPKWLHASTPTQSLCYGLSEASRYKTLVIVEGPGDKWAVGGPACAIFGKTLSVPKAQRIASAIGEGAGRNIVVLLDPEQSSRERAQGKRHHIAIAADVLKKYVACPVWEVYLPLGWDAGALCRGYTRKYIEQSVRNQGGQVDWGLVA